MSSSRAVAPERLAELVRRLAGLRWSWSIAEFEQVLTVLGWRVADGPHDFGAVLDVGADSVDGYADARFRGGAVVQFRLVLTHDADDTAETVTARRDVFATVTRVVTEMAGASTDRRPGERPEIRWAVPAGVLQAIDNGVFVELSLLSADWAESLDESPADVLDAFDDDDDEDDEDDDDEDDDYR